jgi:predicted RNA-binding protein with RPS1 domain
VVQAIVLDIDKASERFSLGIKQTQQDPWKTVQERYEVGKEISGTVTNVTDFGIFLELEEGIEGLVHVSEISKEKIKTPVGQYNVGDELTAKVMNVNIEERRIGLSIKRLDMEDDDALLKDYVTNMKPATSSFGEILRENLQEKLNDADDTAEAADAGPVDETPAEVSPVEAEAVEESPAEEAAAEESPVEAAPVEAETAEESPVEEAAVEENPVEESSTEDSTDEETPAEPKEPTA